jgi:hypothetical protein
VRTVGQPDIFKPGHRGDAFFLDPPEITMVSPVFRHTTKPCRISSGVMMSTLLMNEDGKHLSEMHGSVMCSDAITNGSCIVGSSRWMI